MTDLLSNSEDAGGGMSKMVPRRIFAWALIAASPAGCRFIDLGRGIDKMTQLSAISMMVRQRAPRENPMAFASQLDLAAQARAARVYGFDTDHMGILSDKAAIGLLNRILEEAA